MPRNISPANQAALAARRLVAREFLWVVAKNRISGVPFPYGFWSDVGTISAEVINPDTQLPVTRQFEGSGTLIEIDAIPMVSGVTVQTVGVRMSQISPAVENIIRAYDLRQARVEIFTGMLDPATRLPVAPADPIFVGFVDQAEIITPSENEDGGVTLTCVSHTQELTRANSDTRSHESQLLRNPTDDFFKDAAVVGEWELNWGSESGKIQTSGQRASGKGMFDLARNLGK